MTLARALQPLSFSSIVIEVRRVSLSNINFVTGRNVRVGVVGIGSMGASHLRLYHQLKGVELVGVFDPDEQKGLAAAKQYGCIQFSSLEALLADVDAVSVCAPTSLHLEIGLKVFAAGRHCLMEKPLAPSVSECDQLIQAANAAEVVLLVGHIERFNPAVRQLSTMLDKNSPVRTVDARRLSAVSNRILDVDVVADLMVHDIDIVLSLINSPVSSVVAKQVSVTEASGADHVTALLTFESGSMATLTASRITHHTVRELSATTDAGYVQIDYVDQSMNVYVQDSLQRIPQTSGAFGEYKSEVLMDRVFVRRAEPLQIEVAHFIACIAGKEKPIVPGQHGREAVLLVQKVQESATASAIQTGAKA